MADNNSPTSMVVLNKSDVTRDKSLYFFLEHYQAAFVAEMQAFVNSIREDKPTPVSGNDGLAPVLIALAGQESLRTGKPVKITS